VPSDTDLPGLVEAARDCQGCELFGPATQTVFGAGPPDADLVLVGEQPGDVEDRAGEPFVGPAGRVLRRALEELDVEPEQVYLTNAVKHFSFTERGKRRLHRTPQVGQVRACRPWLAAELALLHPRVVVALGATAGRALAGPDFRVTEVRGRLLDWPSDLGIGAVDPARVRLMGTVHPSAILRADNRDESYRAFLADLRVAARAVGSG
jgi:DNA polymerase